MQIILRWKWLGEYLMIKNSIAAAVSVLLISGASLAAVSAAYAGDDLSTDGHIVSADAAATTASGSDAKASTTTTSTTTAETTTEPVTLKNYLITFLDFDGKVLTTLEVEEGDPIDYNSVDVSSLHKYIDIYTEQDFSSWDIHPDFADDDYTIHALSKTASISLKSTPDKFRYFSTNGNVSLNGLDVSISLSVQLPQKDKNGKYITADSTVDISQSCIAKPSSLSEAFANDDKATISVYPIGDQKPLCSFDIVCYRDLGDVNEDGLIDSIDASKVLNTYAEMAAAKDYALSEKLLKLADVNMDGKLDAHDASMILKYYSEASVNPDFTDWEELIDFDLIEN